MLEFGLLFLFVYIMSNIQIGKAKIQKTESADSEAKKKFVENKSWEFKNLDDCMEFRELRQTGWKGNAEDFYRWKEEE